ncbi:cyclic pyranopterin monophosphate synthase MoaC [Candidatus Margulisiibacteriota bacterium]
MKNFSHIDDQGQAKMVDVSAKHRQKRIATASGEIHLNQETIQKIINNEIAKGNVLTTAKIAGIQAAKQTPNLIPLCHNIALSQVDINFDIQETKITCQSQAIAVDVTGVEMEALTAVSTALLTIYDMCKAVDKTMVISEIKLDKKEKIDV